MAYTEKFMKEALRLAAESDAAVQPNPYVGAVLVKGGRIVGKGRHREFGGPHAEVEALDVPPHVARGAELYVTLEPCSHWGKTPPCSELIIRKGVKRVYVAMEDPNPLVAGQGLEMLRQGGVEVSSGHMIEEAQYLNRIFIKNITTGEPYIILKYAMTADGFIASILGDSAWISGEESRDEVHRMRHNVSGILVGSGTVLRDDPRLSARKYPGGWQPKKVVMDGDGLIRNPGEHALFRNGEGLILGEKNLEVSGFRFYNFKETGNVFTHSFAEILKRENITSLLVEGGASVLTAFIENALFDEVCVFIAPKLLGGGVSPAKGKKNPSMEDSLKLKRIRWEHYGEDIMLRGFK